MQIQINTDHNVEGREKFSEQVTRLIEGMLSRWSEHITRLEVHISDENSDKSGKDDKRCLMEARLEGLQPVAVTHHAESLDQAIHGAAEKLKHRIENILGRLDQH